MRDWYLAATTDANAAADAATVQKDCQQNEQKHLITTALTLTLVLALVLIDDEITVGTFVANGLVRVSLPIF